MFGVWDSVRRQRRSYTGFCHLRHAGTSGAGLTEEACHERGLSYEIGRADLAVTPRGAIAGRGGLLKIIFQADDRKLIGVHCIGEIASEIVRHRPNGDSLRRDARYVGDDVVQHAPRILTRISTRHSRRTAASGRTEKRNTNMTALGRVYNQPHVPRKYEPGKRRFSVYWTWSYPFESNRDVTELNNRFSTMTEVKRVGWPNYEKDDYSARMFLQGIAGTLELFHLSLVNFPERR